MTWGTRFAPLVPVAFLVAGCIGAGGRGPEPPRPDRTFEPEIVGMARDIRSGPCSTMHVNLESGHFITIQLGGSQGGCATKVTTVVLGHLRNDIDDVDGRGALVLAGQIDGEPWVGSAAWRPSVAAWCVILSGDQGAYREANGFHFSSGLLVKESRGFGWIDGTDESRFLPLRSGDDVCLNEFGEVIRADVWNGG